MAGVVVAWIVVVVMVVVSIVGTVPIVVAVVVIEGITAPIGRVPSPGIVVAIAVTVVVGVVAIAIAIVVWIVPATEHIGNVAGLHPHLIAHNHNRIEGGIVGHREEVGIAIAIVVVGRGHTVRERTKALQTTRIGTAVVIHIDIVVDADIATCRGCGGAHGCIGATHLHIAEDGINVVFGLCRSDHCRDAFFVSLPCGSFGSSNLCLGGSQGSAIVHCIEVIGIGGSTSKIYGESGTARIECKAASQDSEDCNYVSHSHHISVTFSVLNIISFTI
jgi:hypothetical protein